MAESESLEGLDLRPNSLSNPLPEETKKGGLIPRLVPQEYKKPITPEIYRRSPELTIYCPSAQHSGGILQKSPTEIDFLTHHSQSGGFH